MRINIIIPPMNKSGGNKVVAIYAKILARRGHSVTVISPINRQPTMKEQLKSFLKNGHSIKYVPREESFFELMDVPVKCLDRPGPIRANDVPDADILLACFWVVARWIHDFPENKGKKIHFIQGYETEPGVNSALIDEAWRLPMKKIVISDWLEKIARGRFHDTDCSIVPNRVDFDFFSAPPRQKQDVLTVGFVFSDTWCKASNLAIEACKIVRNSVPNLKVLVFGEKPPKETPLPDTWETFWNPKQDEIPRIYSQCDVWLWPNKQEGFGLPILEAMACRTPVIGTPAGAAPELLADGRGIIVEFDNPGQMADAAMRINNMTDPEWISMSSAAFNFARGKSWEDSARMLEGVLSDCLSRDID
jgi:glycosyltransferase involved in cell wall biosynthesis